MVLYSEQRHEFNYPLHMIALAHNVRFPSPWSTHVISSDVISRSIHPTTGVIRTTRLVLKRGKMPQWAPRVVASIGTSWVLEETELDLEGHGEMQQTSGGQSESEHEGQPRPRRREMRTRSRNLDHKTVMEVFEWQTFRPLGDGGASAGVGLGAVERTEAFTLSRVTSDFGFWPLQSRIEKFGLSRIPKASEKSRQGIDLIASLLAHPTTSDALLASGPMKPFAFEPVVTSALALSLKAKFDEAREALSRREAEARAERECDEAANGGSGGGGVGGGSGDSESGQIWRERWRAAARRGIVRFKARVCAATGLLCDSSTGTGSGTGTGKGLARDGAPCPPSA